MSSKDTAWNDILTERHPQSKLATVVGLSSKNSQILALLQVCWWMVWSKPPKKKAAMPNCQGLSLSMPWWKKNASTLSPGNIFHHHQTSKVLVWSNKVYYRLVEFEELHPITSPLSAWRRDQTWKLIFSVKSGFFGRKKVGWDFFCRLKCLNKHCNKCLYIHGGRWFVFRRFALFFWDLNKKHLHMHVPSLKMLQEDLLHHSQS